MSTVLIVGIDIGKRKQAADAISPQGENLGPVLDLENTRAGLAAAREVR